jgi:hypothetical protein
MKIKKNTIRRIIRELIKENTDKSGVDQIQKAAIIIAGHLQNLGRNPVRGTLMYFKDELLNNNITDPVLKSLVSQYLQKLHIVLVDQVEIILNSKVEKELIALLGFYVLPDIRMEWSAAVSKDIKEHPGAKAVYNQYKSDIDSMFREVSHQIDGKFQSAKPKYKNTIGSLSMPYAVVSQAYAYDSSFTSEKLGEFYDDLPPVVIINTATNKKYTWMPQGNSLELPDTRYEIYDIIPAEDFAGKSTQGMSMVGYKGPHPISGREFIGVLPMVGEKNPELVDLVR